MNTHHRAEQMRRFWMRRLMHENNRTRLLVMFAYDPSGQIQIGFALPRQDFRWYPVEFLSSAILAARRIDRAIRQRSPQCAH
jgi:hypothetical protein